VRFFLPVGVGRPVVRMRNRYEMGVAILERRITCAKSCA
jgi:hypothetical protein